MSRSPEEATRATRRNSASNVIWGLGIHPSHVARGGEFDAHAFEQALPHFPLVGEVGLDRRSGALERQRQVFREVLRISREHSVLVSIHSAGCVGDALDLITEFDRPGFILHWFSGGENQLVRAIDLGCYFSVNSMMKQHILDLVPLDKMLPETDFPSRNHRGGSKPGDTVLIEQIVAKQTGLTIEGVRGQWYRNLRRIALESGAIDRLPSGLVETLILQGP